MLAFGIFGWIFEENSQTKHAFTPKDIQKYCFAHNYRNFRSNFQRIQHHKAMGRHGVCLRWPCPRESSQRASPARCSAASGTPWHSRSCSFHWQIAEFRILNDETLEKYHIVLKDLRENEFWWRILTISLATVAQELRVHHWNSISLNSNWWWNTW